MGKAEGTECQPSPAELLHGHTGIVYKPLPCNRDSAGSGAEFSACGRMEELAPFSSGTALPSLAEDRGRGPERRMSHPALEAETMWEVATKIKCTGEPVSVFL